MNTYGSVLCVESGRGNRIVSSGVILRVEMKRVNSHHGSHTGKPGRLLMENRPDNMTAEVLPGDVEATRPVLPSRKMTCKQKRD